MATKTKKSAKTKAAAPEVDELDEDVTDELDEMEDDEPVAAAPKKKKNAASDDEEVIFGASDVAALISSKGDKEYTARDLRTLLRKMARDGRIERTIEPGNRTRYSWSGPEDPEVKIIVKAALGGEIEAGKKEALDKLKANKAAKDAEKAKAEPATKTKKKAKPAPVEVEDDDDEDLDDDE